MAKRKEDSARIKKTVLRLGEKDIELTLSQAKELAEILHEMFGKKTVEYHPVIIEKWHWDYWYPTWGTYTVEVGDTTKTITSNTTNTAGYNNPENSSDTLFLSVT